jgi:hypothetical protein
MLIYELLVGEEGRGGISPIFLVALGHSAPHP